MYRWVVLLIAGCVFSTCQAQERTGYVGFGIAYGLYVEAYPSYPMPSIQFGATILDTFELRGTLESLLVVSNLGLDFLYHIELESASTRIYAGGGPSLRLQSFSPIGMDLRGILGGEYTLLNVAVPVNLFAEMRFYLNGGETEFPTLKGRAGINFPL